jgi:uncharacterized membrane protein YfcA
VFDALTSPLLAHANDPKVWFLVFVALCSGVVRGFSGFGGALILIPLGSAVFGPQMGVAIFYLVDLVSATPYGYSYWNRCNFKDISPMLVGHFVALPLGTWLLTSLDPLLLRWSMDGVVFLMLAVLVSGWRYHGKPYPALSFGVGTLAGVMGASSGISAPPVLAYWLGQNAASTLIRANILVYYALTSTATDVIFFWRGLYTWDVLIYALLTWPAYSIGLSIGHKLFGFATERTFRLTAYVLIALTAIISLPLFDQWIRPH